jgi:hypothetical protein
LAACSIEPPVGGLDGDASAVRHRISRIEAEVQQRILELGRVNQHRPQTARADGLDGDARTNRALDHVLHAIDQTIDVGWLGVERLTAREREQAVR